MSQKRNPHGRVNRRRFLTSTGAAGALALAGCASDPTGDDSDSDDTDTTTTTESGGTTADESPDPLKIGLYGPFSGPAANIGQQKQMAYELAVEMINDAGGVDGQDIEFVYGDSESKPAAGRSAVNRLIQNEDIDILGGGFHSDIALSVIEVTQSNDLPQIIDECVSSAIIDKIAENDMQQVFKTAPPSEAYAVGWRKLINSFQEEGIGYFPYEDKTISLIGEDTSYGLSIMDLMKDELDQIGWEVLSTDEVALDETNFSPLLSRIKSNDPDVVWAVQTSSSGSANLVKQFRETGFQDTHFLHNFGLTIGQARQNAGDAANGAMTLINAGKIDTLLEERGVLSAWDSAYDADMTGSAALAYQNVLVITEMVKAAGGLEAFRNLSMDEWESLVIDHEPIKGGTGYIDYQENHQAAWGSTDTIPAIGYQIRGGELNMVWPLELASSEVDESFYQ